MDYKGKGIIGMLNLLKFREIADYSKSLDLQPKEVISGKEAYNLYMKHTQALLEQAGSKVVYFGKCGNMIIGPESEKWDLMILVEHASVEKFMEFVQQKAYLAIAGHRTAALEDSRLLPSTQLN
jgi:uncharacterized protein (DUF1330 family)